MRVAVCGAGVIGASIAYQLSLRGADVVLIERAGVANAASGKSGGFLALDWCDGTPQQQLARISFELHAELARTLDADYGYRPLTTFLVAASERRSLGAHESADRPAWLDGDCAIGGTLGTESTTAQVQPARFTQALVDAACTRGARLVAGTVSGLLLGADRSAARGVSVDGAPVDADAVVIAMGPWCTAFSHELALPPIGGLKGYSVTLRPSTPVPAHALFVDYERDDGERPSPEIVPRPDGEVWLCGVPGHEPVPDDPSRVTVDENACDELKRIAARLSSALGDAEITSRQACYRPICADALPLIGAAPAVERVFVATGHNCWGMLNATGTGLAVCELLLDGAATSIDLAPFDPARFDSVGGPRPALPDQPAE